MAAYGSASISGSSASSPRPCGVASASSSATVSGAASSKGSCGPAWACLGLGCDLVGGRFGLRLGLGRGLFGGLFRPCLDLDHGLPGGNFSLRGRDALEHPDHGRLVERGGHQRRLVRRCRFLFRLFPGLGLRDRGHFPAFCNRVRTRRQRIGPAAGAVVAFERVHQARQDVDSFPQHLHGRRGAFAGAVDDAIEEVLDGPGEFTQRHRPDHPAAALERVESAAHPRQRFAIGGVVGPHGEQALHDLDFLARFLDEDLQHLQVEAAFRRHGRRDLFGCRLLLLSRFRLRFDVTRGFAPPGDRRHATCQLEDDRSVRIRLFHRQRQRLDLWFQARLGLGLRRCFLDRRLRFGRIDCGKAALGVVQHVQGIAAPGLQRLHVVLEADHCISQAVDGLGRQLSVSGQQRLRDVMTDTGHDFHGAGLAQHQQARRHAARQSGDRIEPCHVGTGFQRLGDQFLDAREVHAAFAQHRLRHLPELRVLDRTGQRCAGRHDQPHQRIVQAVFHADQRGRDAYQSLAFRRDATRNQRSQPANFSLHLLPQGAESEHRQRVADLLQQFHLRLEFLRPAALAREQVERVLHATKVFPDRRGDRVHQLDRRARQRVLLLPHDLVDGQHFVEAERGPHRLDSRAVRARPGDVEEHVVQQVERWLLRVQVLAELVNPA